MNLSPPALHPSVNNKIENSAPNADTDAEEGDKTEEEGKEEESKAAKTDKPSK